MASNDNERAEHGDLIEISNPARVDFGKRMQVATAGDVAVTALDNRVRVTIDHGDYKVVRRCGRPATADAVGATVPKVTIPAPRASTPVPVDVPKAKIAPKLTEDEAVAKLDAALYDVQVTRKATPDIEQVARNEQAKALVTRAEGTHTPAKAGAKDRAKLAEAEKAEPGKLETALQAPIIQSENWAKIGDHIELLAHTAREYAAGAELKVIETLGMSGLRAIGTDKHNKPVMLFHTEYRIINPDAVPDLAPGIASCQCGEPALPHLHVDESKVNIVPADISPEAASALGVNRHDMADAFTYAIRSPFVDLSHLTQSQIDERTTKPEAIVPVRKHSHYFRDCPYDAVDIYRLLQMFNVTDQALGHAIKKLLLPGLRGAKDLSKDVQEAIDTLTRWQEMRAEEAKAGV